MPKQQHTHRGHCQVCGRIQAASYFNMVPPINHLAKHGYKVAQFGYFIGTCAGSDHKPLEQCRELTDDTIAALNRWATNQELIAQSFREGNTHPDQVDTLHRRKNPTTGKRESVMIPWGEATEYQQRNEVQRRVLFHETEARRGRAHAQMLFKLAGERYGQSLIPVQPDAGPTPIEAGQTFLMGTYTYTVIGKGSLRRWACRRNDGKVHQLTAVTIRNWMKETTVIDKAVQPVKDYVAKNS